MTNVTLKVEDLANKGLVEIRTNATANKEDIEHLLKAASSDRYLGDFIYQKKLKDIQVFYFNDVAAGFAIPRRDGDGYYRTGPIFVLKEFRQKGIAKSFISEYFKNKKGRAWIEESNEPSMRLYQSMGFKKSGKVIMDDNERLFEYLKSQ